MSPDEHERPQVVTEVPMGFERQVVYQDVVDALSRKLITEEEARTLCRRLFGLR
jgi:uncharacterized protein YutE (UPF0331/DUF86 family)